MDERLRQHFRGENDDRLSRHILVWTDIVSLNLRDLIRHVHAFHHFAKHRVAKVALTVVRKALSATLRKNWLVALSLSAVRAMEMVPRLFNRPLSASF